MSLRDFIAKQWIDVIQWTESEDGVLAYRYPMADMEIQNGGSLTVRESQMAAFVNEGKVADIFGPGLYKLTTQTLPILTYLQNWDKSSGAPIFARTAKAPTATSGSGSVSRARTIANVTGEA